MSPRKAKQVEKQEAPDMTMLTGMTKSKSIRVYDDQIDKNDSWYDISFISWFHVYFLFKSS